MTESNLKSIFKQTILCFFLSIINISSSKAQFWKIDSDFGSLIIGVEPSNVAEYGAFGTYLGPEKRKSVDHFFGRGHKTGQSAGGSSNSYHKQSFLRTILPSGKLPSDGKFSYNAGLGYKLLIGFEPRFLRGPDRQGVILNAFYLQDRNKVKFFAPSGLGVFTDPTTLTGRVKAQLIGFEAKAPIWSAPSLDGQHSLFGSIGYARVLTETTAIASSDFLDIQLREKKNFWTPLFSTEYHFDPTQGVMKMLSTQLKISAYRSQDMYSGIFSCSIIINF